MYTCYFSIADNLVTVTVFIRVRTEPPSQKEGISGLCQTINQFFINSYDAEKKELWGRNYIRWCMYNTTLTTISILYIY